MSEESQQQSYWFEVSQARGARAYMGMLWPHFTSRATAALLSTLPLPRFLVIALSPGWRDYEHAVKMFGERGVDLIVGNTTEPDHLSVRATSKAEARNYLRTFLSSISTASFSRGLDLRLEEDIVVSSAC